MRPKTGYEFSETGFVAPKSSLSITRANLLYVQFCVNTEIPRKSARENWIMRPKTDYEFSETGFVAPKTSLSIT